MLIFYDQNNDYTVCGVCTPFQADVHYHSGGYAFMLYDPSEYVGHCYVKCYPEQQKEVVKWIEKIRREVLPENISYQVRTFQDDLYEIQAMEYMLKDTILSQSSVSSLPCWVYIPALPSILNVDRKKWLSVK